MKRKCRGDIAELIETVDCMMQAFGSCGDDKDSPLYQIAWRALCDVEDLFCRTDWRAYRDWAQSHGAEYGYKPEPCEAWYEINDKTAVWPDEQGT